MWSDESRVMLIDYEIHRDRKKFILEDKFSGDFYEMPLLAVVAIGCLSKRKTVKETEEYLKAKYPQEEVNMAEFINQLIELNLITQIDDRVIHVRPVKRQNDGFLWIKKTFAMKFFNRFSRLFFCISFSCSVLLIILYPSLFPHYKDLFWSDIMLYNILIFSIVSLILVLIHEAGHVLAARSFDIPVRLSLGHRLFFPVLESDVSNLWKIPRENRNRVYLAGINFDIAILFLSFILQKFIFEDTEGLPYALTAIINFNILVRIIYQCCFYMKTDLYYVVENLTGRYNLMEEAKEYLKEIVTFPKKSKAAYGNTIKVYSVIYIIGTLISISLFLFYYIPQLAYAVKATWSKLYHPVSTLQFWDGMIFFIQLALMVFILIFSWMRGLRNYLLRVKKV
ncbi:site-2 protease family protein [Bacillus salacetis]|uniref:site-2 protease family protein n=1 Tax=Bacillus salacetis TaxID=2315464 RepID=UPI003B9E7CCB